MADITLIVRIKPKPGKRAAFLDRLERHAEDCRTKEPGCRRFEVFVPCEGDDERVFLVETYAGEEGLQAHRDSAHLASYREDTNPLIEDREIVDCRTVTA